MSRQPAELSIRPAAADVPAIRDLAEQLGYPATEEETAQRFAVVAGDANQAVLVAERAERLVGLAHVVRQDLLLVAPRADLGGFVVDAHHRGQGIGSRLLVAAEQRARARGCGEFQVRSNVTRADAHRFSERRGYACQKTSKVFRKRLG